jgi:hypothetical protein
MRSWGCKVPAIDQASSPGIKMRRTAKGGPVKDVLLVIMCALSIVVAALLLYIVWLLYVTHELLKATRRRLRPPQVARDGEGRPLKERV